MKKFILTINLLVFISLLSAQEESKFSYDFSKNEIQKLSSDLKSNLSTYFYFNHTNDSFEKKSEWIKSSTCQISIKNDTIFEINVLLKTTTNFEIDNHSVINWQNSYHFSLGKYIYYSVNIPITYFQILTNDPSVQKIETNKKMVRSDTESAPLINADKVWFGDMNGMDELISGEGVYIGIIELGTLRATHEAFQNGDMCRIEKLWNFEENNTVNDFTDCSSYPFSTDPNDFTNTEHAANVTSIAAGGVFNNNQTVKGIANKSDILFAKIENSNDIIKAISAMVDHVDGKPLVINISLSSFFGSRDGNTSQDSLINEIISLNDNLTVCASVANCAKKYDFLGNLNTGFPHIQKKLNLQSNTSEIIFEVKATIEKTISLDFWFDGLMTVEVSKGNASSGIMNPGDAETFEAKKFWGVKKDVISVYHDSSFTKITIQKDGGFNQFAHDDYKITYRLLGNEEQDVTIDGYQNIVNTFGSGFKNGDSYQSFSFPASAKNVLSVASFDKTPANTLSDFSSWGPYRNENLVKASIPNISAPGGNIIGAGNTNNFATATQSGTSQASPHVAGAIALLLQNFPSIDNQQMASLLLNTANSTIPGFEKAKWGKGKLDVLAAYKYLVGFQNDLNEIDSSFRQTYTQHSENNIGLPIGPIQENFDNSSHNIQSLTNGALFKNTFSEKCFWLSKSIWEEWISLGGIQSEAGLPTSSVNIIDQNITYVNFENCTIFFDQSSQETSVTCCENQADLTFIPNAATLTITDDILDMQNAIITNNGSCDAGAFDVYFVISSNTIYDTEDAVYHIESPSNLQVGSNHFINFTKNIAEITQNLPNGTYYVILVVDALNTIAESNETNNQGSWNSPTISIQESYIDCSNAEVIYCGSEINSTNEGELNNVTNYNCSTWSETGPEKIFRYNHELAGDIDISLSNMSNDLDVFLLNGCDEYKCLAADDTDLFYSNAPAGIYYIVVDGYQGNIGDFTITIDCSSTSTSNLIFDNPNSINVQGQNVNATLTIKNESCNGDSGSSIVRSFLSTDFNYDGSNDVTVQDIAIPSLGPNESYTTEISFNSQNETNEDGIFFLGYLIDYYDEIEETNENDNDFIWLGSDYQIINPSASPNLTIYQGDNNSIEIINGTIVNHSIDIINVGGSSASSFSTTFYLSQESSDYDYELYNHFTASLNAGGIETIEYSVDANNLNLNDGIYFLEWRIDDNSSVSESNESDNNWYYSGGTDQVIISNSSYCNSTTILTDKVGEFDDGSGSSNYENDAHCLWYISPEGTNQTITFYLSKINLQSGDNIYVYDGPSKNSPILATFSGSNLPSAVTSNNDQILVEFSSSSSSVDQGFEAGYFVNDISYCGGFNELVEGFGEITDGSGCAGYQHSADCSWLINPSQNNAVVSLSFNYLALEENIDFLTIYKGIDENGTLLGRYSGNQLPDDLMVNGPVFISFTSNAYENDEGFSLVYLIEELAPIDISGQIKTTSNSPINFVQVQCTDQVDYLTNTSGNYLFEHLSTFNNFTVTPTKTDEWADHLDLLDYWLLSSYLAGQSSLSPYQLIAADINNSKDINQNDLDLLFDIIQKKIDNVPNSQPWQFVKSDYEFPIPTNPWFENFPSSITYFDVETNKENQDFYGVKVGDLAGDAETKPLNSKINNRSKNTMLLNLNSTIIENELTLDFTKAINKNIDAFQLSLAFNNDHLIIKNIYSDLYTLTSSITGNTINILATKKNNLELSPYNSDLFTLSFDNLNNEYNPQDIELLHQNLEPTALVNKNEFWDLTLAKNDLIYPFTIFQNNPNPFIDYTKIPFELPSNCWAIISIFDSNGKKIHTVKNDYKKGMNDVTLNGDIFTKTGVYSVQIKTPFGLKQIKIIAIN